MLFEVKHLKQDSNKLKKRWFCDNYFDLLLWVNKDEEIVKFELSYQKSFAEKVLAWTDLDGYQLHDVADEDLLWSNERLTPSFRSEQPFNADILASTFKSAGSLLDKSIVGCIYKHILAFGQKLTQEKNATRSMIKGVA